jgi:hypothetical protein
MYKLTETVSDLTKVKSIGIINLNKNTTIPFDPANTDYQEYLKWLNEGNTPEPAEE